MVEDRRTKEDEKKRETKNREEKIKRQRNGAFAHDERGGEGGKKARSRALDELTCSFTLALVAAATRGDLGGDEGTTMTMTMTNTTTSVSTDRLLILGANKPRERTHDRSRG